MQKPIELTGRDLLRDPRLNKGSAFTEAERRQYHLEGLLPPGCSSLELQVARTHTELAALDNDLQKYLLLSDLQARNETLFYATIMSDPATFMPLVYTPTVGEACQKFAHIFREARGIYLPITAPHSPPTAAGYVQYGANGIGSISCTAPAAAPTNSSATPPAKK